MNIIFDIFKEAFFVGIITIIIGIIIKYFINLFFKEINIYVFILILFITGFVIHIECQIIGINKYYCKNGAACKNINSENINSENINSEKLNSEKLNSEIIHPASYK